MMQMIIALDEEKFDTREQMVAMDVEIKKIAQNCGIIGIDGFVYKGCNDAEDFVRFSRLLEKLTEREEQYLPYMEAWHWDEFDAECEGDMGQHYVDDVLAEVSGGKYMKHMFSDIAEKFKKVLPDFQRKQFKVLSFDLNKEELQKIVDEYKAKGLRGFADYREAYRKIQNFLEGYDTIKKKKIADKMKVDINKTVIEFDLKFERLQQSVYISNRKMSKTEMSELLTDMAEKLSWADRGIGKISITNAYQKDGEMVKVIFTNAEVPKLVEEKTPKSGEEETKKKKSKRKS